MSSPCVQPFHQDSINHDNQNATAAMLRFVNPNNLNHVTPTTPQAFHHYDYHFIKRQQQQQQHHHHEEQESNQRRFSYTSMLSDPEPCYLPISHSPSNESEDATTSSSSSVSPTPTMPYETNYNSSLPPMMDKPFYYNQSLFNSNRATTMYTPPPPNPVINANNKSNIISPYMSTPKPEMAEDFNNNSQQKKVPRSRGRRVSNNPNNNGARMFTCKTDGCGKIFKRSEHLKRHIRSIHTLEKPFECPYHSCNKRFSRSDNLNQHIRIHRHSNVKESGSKLPSQKSTYNNNNNFSNFI